MPAKTIVHPQGLCTGCNKQQKISAECKYRLCKKCCQEKGAGDCGRATHKPDINGTTPPQSDSDDDGKDSEANRANVSAPASNSPTDLDAKFHAFQAESRSQFAALADMVRQLADRPTGAHSAGGRGTPRQSDSDGEDPQTTPRQRKPARAAEIGQFLEDAQHKFPMSAAQRKQLEGFFSTGVSNHASQARLHALDTPQRQQGERFVTLLPREAVPLNVNETQSMEEKIAQTILRDTRAKNERDWASYDEYLGVFNKAALNIATSESYSESERLLKLEAWLKFGRQVALIFTSRGWKAAQQYYWRVVRKIQHDGFDLVSTGGHDSHAYLQATMEYAPITIPASRPFTSGGSRSSGAAKKGPSGDGCTVHPNGNHSNADCYEQQRQKKGKKGKGGKGKAAEPDE